MRRPSRMEERIARIKDKLARGMNALRQEDAEWLLKRVESLGEEVTFLKKELAYLDHQGEVGY
jgi:hypothetical protein